MKRIKSLFGLFLFLLVANTGFSTSWTSVAAGFWNDPSTWSTNTIPPYSSSDTFYIKHPVAFQDNLFFNNAALLKIDSAGGLCGHHNITAATGSTILKYGIIELDTMNIPGGHVNFYAPGQAIFTMNGTLSSGGSLSVSGCSLAVGPWFECVQPTFSFTIGITEYNKETVHVFPDPATDHFTFSFQTDLQNAWLQITDISGRAVYSSFFSGKEHTVPTDDWKNGMYYWTVITKGQPPLQGKALIIK
ncbi:MAG: hypothetical protein JWO44_1130 [Bacteroidetes bacterium]|nr:hypothetical protein [Bacteroidota bacterium]